MAPLDCCSAELGFDLASGLGSVDLGRLALVASALQPPISTVALNLPGQRPVARHRLQAKVNCSSRCVVQAGASITITGARGFGVGSKPVVLGHGGPATLKLSFSSGQLTRLRRALRRRQKIDATVTAKVVDPAGTVESVSPARALQIRG